MPESSQSPVFLENSISEDESFNPIIDVASARLFQPHFESMPNALRLSLKLSPSDAAESFTPLGVSKTFSPMSSSGTLPKEGTQSFREKYLLNYQRPSKFNILMGKGTSPAEEELRQKIPEIQVKRIRMLLERIHTLLNSKEFEINRIVKGRLCAWILFHLTILEGDDQTDKRTEIFVINMLAKVLFLLDRKKRKNKLLQLFISDTPRDDIPNHIQAIFKEELMNVKVKLKDNLTKYQSASIVPPDIAIRHDLPVEIAKLLVCSDGGIHEELIREFKKDFNPKGTRSNFSINLDYALTQLENSAKLRHAIEMVKAPEHPEMASNDVIRCTLFLSKDRTITDRHARITVLSGLLSRLRQGPDGGCFAIYLGITMLQSNLFRCVEDFSSLIEKGYIERRLNHVTIQLPFLCRSSNEYLNRTIKINKAGKLYNLQTKQYDLEIWETPTLINVCHLIGIQDPKKAIKDILERYFPDSFSKRQTTTVTLEVFLNDLARYAYETTSDQMATRDYLLSQTRFAASSIFTNPIQNVWINSIANGAESHLHSQLKNYIYNSIIQTTEGALKKIPGEESFKDQLFHRFSTILRRNLNILYDPNIRSKTQENSSQQGGFVLHQSKSIPGQPKSNIPILDGDKMAAFLKDLIEEAYRKEKGGQSFKQRKRLSKRMKPICESLKEYFEKDHSIIELVANYQNVIPFENGDPTEYEDLQCTPWINLGLGHDSKHLLEIYLGGDRLSERYEILPKTAKFLAKKFIKYCRSLTDEEKEKYIENETRLIPARIVNYHAFSLMIGHPSIRSAWQQSDIPPEKWIDSNIYIPGRLVAEMFSASPKYQELVLRRVIEQFCSFSNREEVTRQITKKADHTCSFHEYRTILLDTLADREQYDERKKNKVSSLLDQILFDYLPSEITKELPFIPFADTNYHENHRDVHFAFGWNPFSHQIEIFEVTDDKCRIRTLPQSTLLDQIWELYKFPEEIL